VFLHKTSNGRIISIPAMTDEHLFNTIKLLLREINELRQIINEEAKIKAPDRFTEKLYNVYDEETMKEYEETAKELTRNIMPYLLEGTLRGMDLRNEFQNAFGRNKALGGNNWIPLKDS